jgi:PAS domain S-box-containing protein
MRPSSASRRFSRWSNLPLRTKGIIVVALPTVPAAFLCLLLVIGLTRQTAAGPRTPRQERNAHVVQAVVLVASLVCMAGGLAISLALGNGLRDRIAQLAQHADALSRGELPQIVPRAPDEIGDLAVRLDAAARLLRDREQAVKASAQSLDRFFNLSRDLFCIAGLEDGRFRQLNPAWSRTLGVDVEQLRGTPFIDWVHPEDRAQTEAAAAALARGQEIVDFENRYRTAAGGYRWLLWSARASHDEGAIYATARDATDSREARERLNTLNAELRHQARQLTAANAELEAFSYSVSHDLRAPLRAIDGFSRIVAEEAGPTLNPDAARALERVQAAAGRMSGLIDDLLQLSRLSRLEMRRTTVDLSAMAEQIVADLRQRAPDRQVDVQIAPGLSAAGDERMLQVLLQNLLENAWKYTGRTPDARIAFTASPWSGTTAFMVADNGVGFDMAYVGKLFQAFQRLHSDREFEGTGIGLATVQRVVRRHGGRTWAEGRVGEGARISFTLAPEDDSDAQEDSAG